jgi:hypothetical protein
MLKRTLVVAAVLLTSGTFAFGQDDTSAVLDDASNVAQTAAGEELALDDAQMDEGAEVTGTQAANGGPLAFGTVTASGSKSSGTANWSSSYNSTHKRYEISISGQSYYYLNYATLITPAGDQRFCNSSSVGGKLLVYCYDSNGNGQQSRFGFVTFKP